MQPSRSWPSERCSGWGARLVPPSHRSQRVTSRAGRAPRRLTPRLQSRRPLPLLRSNRRLRRLPNKVVPDRRRTIGTRRFGATGRSRRQRHALSSLIPPLIQPRRWIPRDPQPRVSNLHPRRRCRQRLPRARLVHPRHPPWQPQPQRQHRLQLPRLSTPGRRFAGPLASTPARSSRRA